MMMMLLLVFRILGCYGSNFLNREPALCWDWSGQPLPVKLMWSVHNKRERNATTSSKGA